MENTFGKWTLSCGCSIFVEPNSSPLLNYCPKHKSAPDLYEACKMLLHAVERDCVDRGKEELTIHKDSPFIDTFRKAITKAEDK